MARRAPGRLADRHPATRRRRRRRTRSNRWLIVLPTRKRRTDGPQRGSPEHLVERAGARRAGNGIEARGSCRPRARSSRRRSKSRRPCRASRCESASTYIPQCGPSPAPLTPRPNPQSILSWANIQFVTNAAASVSNAASPAPSRSSIRPAAARRHLGRRS
jgi:hypothetical protein